MEYAVVYFDLFVSDLVFFLFFFFLGQILTGPKRNPIEKMTQRDRH